MKTINKLFIGIYCMCAINQPIFAQEKKEVSSKLPNIVLIMADDMGYECLGVNGSAEYKTPNLDVIASKSIRFDHAFSQPLCTPSRVKIMTGKYNFRNYEDFGYLNPNQETFANLLKKAGYATCIAGKWQLNGNETNREGNQDTSRPNHFGFDEYCLWQLTHPRKEGERYANPLITQNGKDLPRDKDAYGPDIFTNFILDFIDRKSATDEPFLVYYPMALVHAPFVPTPDSPEWSDPSRRYENDTTYFDDQVAYTDKLIGKISTKLKEKGEWENTLFIFCGDNGTKSNVITNTIYGGVVGGKGKTINTGNHVPMIMSWPDKIKKERIFPGVVDFSDILPTIADVAKINSSNYKVDGQSYLGILNGSYKPVSKEVFIHYTPRKGKGSHGNRWVLDGEYKLYQEGLFYNTLDDPDEKNPLGTNLTPYNQKIKEEFKEILESKEKEFPFQWNNERFVPKEERIEEFGKIKS